MTAEVLLQRLQRVTRSTPGRWRAICPAHESRHRTQSLAIRELNGGTLLLRCHAGCDIDRIVASVGLQLRDLFPSDHVAPAEPRRPQKAGHWHTLREAVQTLHFECLVCAIAAGDVAAGRPITPEDAARVLLAGQRVRAVLEACL